MIYLTSRQLRWASGQDITHKLKPLKAKIFKKFKKTLDILKVLWYT